MRDYITERKIKVYETIHDAYLGTLNDVWNKPDFICAPRGLKIREKIDYTFEVINPTYESIITKDPERNIIIADYTKKENDLYNNCSNSVSDFEKASTFWKKIANPDGTITSAYGYLIFKNKSCGNLKYNKQAGLITPWEFAKQCLIRDKDTRQAHLKFSLPEHLWDGAKDVTCTLHANFLIREDKLFMAVVMRSNDLVKGLVYDMPWFCSLMHKMVNELKSTYPNLEVGRYTHTVHSLHCYENDAKKILGMLGKI